MRELNERAVGLGWARTVTDPDGDRHMLFLFGFHESHNKVQWNAGYAYTTFWGPQDGLRAGLGFSTFIIPQAGHCRAACPSRRCCRWRRSSSAGRRC